MALQNGEVDAWIGLPDLLEPFQDNDNFNITNYSEGRVAYMRLNPMAESMKDKNYREGILYALNRKDIMLAGYSDEEFFKLGYSFLPYTNDFYTEDVEKWDQDVKKAKELTENGAKNLKICYVEEDTVQTNQALTIQAQLKEIGITVELAGMNLSLIHICKIRSCHDSRFCDDYCKTCDSAEGKVVGELEEISSHSHQKNTSGQ